MPKVKDYEFKMPDGQILHKTFDVDRYYNLKTKTTCGRLRCGWSEDECAMNKRDTVRRDGNRSKSVFKMPDGTVLRSNKALDKYLGLANGTTSQRLHRGWTVEECIQNFRFYKSYVFNMPDGTVLSRPREVDKYHGISKGCTTYRLSHGWTLDECSANKRDTGYEFHMPDGSVYTKCSDVDRYYNLPIGRTRCRLSQGWTVDRCENNQHKVVFKNHRFEMPDGSILTSPTKVDR